MQQVSMLPVVRVRRLQPMLLVMKPELLLLGKPVILVRRHRPAQELTLPEE